MSRTLLLSLSVAILAGCGQEEDSASTDPQGLVITTGGFDTPEAAFQAFQTAAVSSDFTGAVACMSPQSQETMAFMITIPVAFMIAFEPDKQASFEELVAGHGLNMENGKGLESPDALDAIPDKAAYIADVMAWMEENGANQNDSGLMSAIETGTLGDVTVDGDKAHATVTATSGATEDMAFARIDGRWFVHIDTGPQFQLSGGANGAGFDTTMEFPDFGPEGFTGGFSNEPAAPIEAVTLEEFNSAWQVSLNVENQPAGELLMELAEGLGLAFDAASGNELAKNVTLNVERVSRFEAVERICEQIDARPDWSPEALTLKSGRRTLPVVFAGPLLFEVTEFKTQSEYATGDITIRAFTKGLPPAVLEQLNGSMGASSIATVTDAAGNDLRRPRGMGESYTQTSGVYDRNMMTGLRNLLRSVSEVKEISGKIKVSLPTEVAAIALDQLQAGVEKSAGDVKLKIDSADGGNFTIDVKGANEEAIQILAYDANGERVEPFSHSYFGGNQHANLTLGFQNPPARMEARIAVTLEPVEYEFAIRDLPVPNHEQMPEALTELTFDGATPLTLEYVKLAGNENFRQAVFKASNHSNKEIRNVSLMMHFLDSDGKELAKNSSFYTGDAIPAGGELEIQAAAFFMPDGTESIRGSIELVEFADASEWNIRD